MLVLISSAKTMAEKNNCQLSTVNCQFKKSAPRFISNANEIALYMAQYPVEDLMRILKVNPKIAIGNYQRYREFHSDSPTSLPAILAYTGVVFRYMDLKNFAKVDFDYAQDHLRLGSGLYGLLRPLDAIKPYRIEYDVRIPELGDKRIDAYWRDKLTGTLIEDVKKAGGTLINLAASDVLLSFHWKEVTKSVRVITPDFKMWKDGKLKSIVIYLKMARGRMSRHIIQNRITNPELLKDFIWEGFSYNEELSTADNWIFTLEI